MSLPPEKSNFNDIIRSVSFLDLNEVQSLQAGIRNLLIDRRFEATSPIPPNINMAYFEVAKNSGNVEDKPSIRNLLEIVTTLTVDELFTLDLMTIFLLHNKNLSEALPEISERATVKIDGPD